MPPVDAPPPLLRPAAGAAPGVFELCHPLGLRGLAGLAGAPIAPGGEVRAAVTVLHLLECQDDLERELLRAGGPRLALALRGPLSFSGEELRRLAPEVTPAQVEGALRLLLGWARRAPQRLEACLDASFAGLTPWTTPLDLRRHLDGLHRHELALDPLTPLALGGDLAERARREGLILAEPGDDGLAFRFADEDTGPLVREARAAATPSARQERLRRALDEAAGVPRGEKKKHLRLLPAPRYDERRPARTGHVALTRAPERRPPRQRAAEAIASVRRVAREGARELVLGGAEGLALEWYLDDLVALARSLRFERVVLEAGAAALAEPGRAAALANAGLAAARVAIDALDEVAVGAVRALLDAGVSVELAVALRPGDRGALARIVREVPRRLPASRGRVERVVARHVPGRLAIGAAAAELLEGARAASLAGIALAAAPGSAPPPCVFDDLEAAAGVLQLGEALVNESREHARIALCEGCGAGHVCPGPLRELAAEVAAAGRRVPAGAPGVPLTRERERVLRELRSVLYKTGPGGEVAEHRVLRVNFHCNQACDFCFVSRELPPPEDALLQAELAEVARRGASLAISGGEPTLNPRLAEYLARAVALGIADVQLQTNAVKMSDPAYTAELVAAGLRRAFVSLHGTSAATSDRVTAAPGTFVRTVAGIKNLVAAGVAVCLNFVLCAYNAAELAELPAFVAREILAAAPTGGSSPPAPAVTINFSFVAAGSENVPRDTGLIPRFSDVAWALAAALAGARALGIPLLGFDSQCGVPACFLPEEVRAAWFVEDLPAEETDAFAGAFRKGEACAECALTRRCYGLRAAYAETYGTGELRPIPAVSAPPRAGAG